MSPSETFLFKVSQVFQTFILQKVKSCLLNRLFTTILFIVIDVIYEGDGLWPGAVLLLRSKIKEKNLVELSV